MILSTNEQSFYFLNEKYIIKEIKTRKSCSSCILYDNKIKECKIKINNIDIECQLSLFQEIKELKTEKLSSNARNVIDMQEREIKYLRKLRKELMLKNEKYKSLLKIKDKKIQKLKELEFKDLFDKMDYINNQLKGESDEENKRTSPS